MDSNFTNFLWEKHPIFTRITTGKFTKTLVDSGLLNFSTIWHLKGLLQKENYPDIFVIQKLTDMVPTKNKTYRSWPPWGTIEWWEQD
jgi:hypothetical protein